jgi:hypothetical protein
MKESQLEDVAISAAEIAPSASDSFQSEPMKRRCRFRNLACGSVSIAISIWNKYGSPAAPIKHRVQPANSFF